MSKAKHNWTRPLAAAWFVAAVAGSVWLTAYAQKPGLAAQPESDWPAGSRLVRDPVAPTLVLALHPKCPCSSATLNQLSQVIHRANHRGTFYALLVTPAGKADAWADSRIVGEARAVPGLRVIEDVDGVEAALFDAKTSGQVAVFDAAGRLAFAGGITASRGHEGDNAGQDAAERIFRGEWAGETMRTSVFGCGLARPKTEGRP
jgi:hypothetical protein